jgi:carboxymethylenebutenolidase
MILSTTLLDVAGPAGPIRVHMARPASVGRRFPAVLFYTDIFQHTPSTLRVVARLAGHGFVVCAPELYGRIAPPGTQLDFERDRQRALDCASKLHVTDLDDDRRAVLDALKREADVDAARIGAVGFCYGGHLAFRAAFEPDVRATACCYPTGVHSGKLGVDDDTATLARAGEIHGSLLLVWGRRDPHIPAEGRAAVRHALTDKGVRFEERVFDAEHAFMRDEGPRYDPAATDEAFSSLLGLLRTQL